MANVAAGYFTAPAGYYKETDRSGPYSIASDGTVTLMTVLGTTDPFGSNKVVIYDSLGNALVYNDLIQTKVVRPTITMDTAVYADGDCMGGLITLTDFARTSAGSGILTRLGLKTVLNFSAQMFVHIFDANPSASTFTDNAALVIHANDRTKRLKSIAVAAAGAWEAPKGATGEYSFECIDPSVGRMMLPYELASNREIYLAFEADGAVDFVAATDFSVIVAAENN